MPRKPTGTLFYRICKRTFDIAFSAGCTAVLAIPMACVCAAICAESPGCPVYTQERVGRGGRVIRVLKLRSMVADANDVHKYLSLEQLHQWEVERKVDDDPRITRVGRFIRKCSIDEVPQSSTCSRATCPLSDHVPSHVTSWNSISPTRRRKSC